jgi:RimJ/RimL family protein N-acetyltransferase
MIVLLLRDTRQMRHSIALTCTQYQLRPVDLDDAAFILTLRSDPVRSRYLHEVSPDVKDQVAWIERYFERAGDYYFIVEDARSGEPQGTIGLYDIAPDAKTAEWGRWIVKPDSMAALESVWLISEVAFSQLGLESIVSRTLAENPRVASFHESFGASRVRISENHFVRGEAKSAIEHRITAAKWPALRARHLATIRELANRA